MTLEDLIKAPLHDDLIITIACKRPDDLLLDGCCIRAKYTENGYKTKDGRAKRTFERLLRCEVEEVLSAYEEPTETCYFLVLMEYTDEVMRLFELFHSRDEDPEKFYI